MYTTQVTEAFSVMILAGGRSSRMGKDKAFLELDGQTLIERVLSVVSPLTDDPIIVAREQAPFAALPARVVEDAPGPPGALNGLYSGLLAARHELAFAVACDMPFLHSALIRHMAGLAPGYDVVIPRVRDWFEPLHAFYRRSCLPWMDRALQKGDQKILAFFPHARVRYVEQDEVEAFDPQLCSFVNVNTPEDWARVREQST